MKKLTYKEAYDKIIEAYFKDEIQVFNATFCFCGTLCGSAEWRWRDDVNRQYSYKEFGRMEKALFSTFPEVVVLGNACLDGADDIERYNDFEERLFSGMCAALEVLKEIHKERGEDVDGVQEFTKRNLSSLKY